MHETQLSRNYEVQIEILTPLHVGNGVVLKRDFEFVLQNGKTYRLNDSALLQAFWPADAKQQEKIALTRPADLLGNTRLSHDDAYVLYAYNGSPAMGEIREQIKDVFGHAYVPGSSLKGGLRTALMRTMIEGVAQHSLTRADLGRAMRNDYDARAAKEADDMLDRKYGGFDPNHDMFRGLSIADTTPAPKNALTLQRVQMVPKLEIDVEALAIGSQLKTSLRLDRYILQTVAAQLGIEKKFANTIRNVARAVQFTAETRIRQELTYHIQNNHAQAVHFYYEQLQRIQQKKFADNECLLQVGFAAGWRAKTLLGGLPDNDPLLEKVIGDFYLDKGGKGQGSHASGDAFPKARHLAFVGRNPALPMGWVKMVLS